jgi:rhodanese-related sulfurtransferase
MHELFNKTGFILNGNLNLTPRQAQSLCQLGAVLIDVREEFMNRYKMFDVPETVYCPFSILGEHWKDLPLSRPMIFADASGIHSVEAVKFMAGKGEGQNSANLAGGLVEWERDGMPLVIDNSEKLSGSCVCQLKPRNKKN